jgi:hypothetical protein
MCRLINAIVTIAALWAAGLLTATAALAQPPPEPAPAAAAPASTAEPATPTAALPVPDAPDAKALAAGHFKKGKELFAKNAWAAALSEFLESRKLFPTWSATSNAAICLKNLQRYDEALSMLELLLNDFQATVPPNIKEAAQREVIEMRKSTGSIVIDDAELGATLSIDGRLRGEYPAPPLYVLSGSHVVRVYKEGFEAFEKRADVAPGQTVKISARMQRLVHSGRLEITERSGKKLDVIVDGFHVGETPWEGPIAVGDHSVMLRGTEGLGTRPTPISIRLNQRLSLALAAVDLGASLRIQPVPADASVAIDGIFVGRGAWDGRLNPGDHPIKVVADGYFPETRRVALSRGSQEVLNVALKKDPDSPLWRSPGRFFVEAGAAMPLTGGFGGEISASCVDTCSRTIGYGGYASAHGGYELGTGFSFGLTAGYVNMVQDTTNRLAELTVTGVAAPTVGTADDTIKVRGVFAGAFAGLKFGDRFPLRLRMNAGVSIGSVADIRYGSFHVKDPTVVENYDVGPVVEAPSMVWFYMEPEVRMDFKLTSRVDLSVGLGGLLLISPDSPTWDETHAINASDDGYGTFAAEVLANQIVFAVTPGASVRYTF